MNSRALAVNQFCRTSKEHIILFQPLATSWAITTFQRTHPKNAHATVLIILSPFTQIYAKLRAFTGLVHLMEAWVLLPGHGNKVVVLSPDLGHGLDIKNKSSVGKCERKLEQINPPSTERLMNNDNDILFWLCLLTGCCKENHYSCEEEHLTGFLVGR